MMNDRARAHGRAAHAVVRWLHGRPMVNVSLGRPLDHGEDSVPRSRDAIEETIRRRLSGAVGEMVHVAGDPVDHIRGDRPEVQESLRLARMLPGTDPVDHLESCLEDLLACLLINGNVLVPSLWLPRHLGTIHTAQEISDAAELRSRQISLHALRWRWGSR